jgi:hypothetical protein
MPTWSEVLQELNHTRVQGGPPKFDDIRRKYLTSTFAYTGRNVILYASKFTQQGSAAPEAISINDEDLQGLMEVVHGLSGPNLDLILHSPGGRIESAEALVSYLRSKFNHIRVVVPQVAMSAATMMACAADVIVLGKHSFLGPIDPQVIIPTPLGPRMVPAQAILQQFERAKTECKDPQALAAWYPMLSQYGPDLLAQCENASRLSQSLVAGWLRQYMFKNDSKKLRKAPQIAKWLASHKNFMTHSRHIPRQDLQAKGLEIFNLENDQKEQDLFLSVFHATTHTFSGTLAVKIIENHLGKAFVQQQPAPLVQIIPQGLIPGIPQNLGNPKPS